MLPEVECPNSFFLLSWITAQTAKPFAQQHSFKRMKVSETESEAKPSASDFINSWNSLRFQQAEIFLEFMKPTKAEDEPDAELVCLLVSVNSLNQANKVWLELSELMKPQPANQPQSQPGKKPKSKLRQSRSLISPPSRP